MVLLLAVGFPRLMLSGSLPSTDEGVFAFYAQLAHAALASGHGLPDGGPLALYPILLSWIFALDVNHIVFLRLADMAVAIAASWLLYDVLVEEAGDRPGGAVIAALALFTMNQPLFIQAGFKNSLFAAYVPLFAAMRVAQRADAADRRRWTVCGALLSLSVLLRETFVPFLAVGAVAVAIAGGRRALLRLAVAGALTAAAVLLVAIACRGGVRSMLDAYREAGTLYEATSSLRHALLVNGATASAKEAWLPLAIAALGALWVVGRKIATEHRRDLLGRLLFWLAIALVPLIEPLSKIGFPYHYSVCLPGLAGLAALGWRTSLAGGNAVTRRRIAASLLALAVLMSWPKIGALEDAWPATWDTLDTAVDGPWPGDAVKKSNYLLAAQEIRRVSPPHGTLSVSGFMLGLFPLTGLLPPSYEMSHLTARLIALHLDEEAFARALAACPPDVLMTTTRTDWPGADVLDRAVRNTRLYEEAAVIPVDMGKSYGNFGGTLFRRLPGVGASCDTRR